MKPTQKKNIDDIAITLEVEADVVERVRKGEFTHIRLDVNEYNQNLVLENYEGNLMLMVDELPPTFHGCYFYNEGEFPYIIKSSLSFLCLSSEEDSILVRIIGVKTEPGIRFYYQGAGKDIVEDANGDSCVWEISFEILPIPEEPKHYLMRWNPSISSFTEKDFEHCVANMERGMFRINWSINEWKEARRGDIFYMMRVGDKNAGIVLGGQFISDPYPSDDWAGSSKRRMYVDMICTNPVHLELKPYLPLEKLQKAIPSVDWGNGHSGILLPEDVAKKLHDLINALS